MYELRKVIRVWVSVLVFGLTVGIAHADNDSTDGMSLEPRDQSVTENLVVDLATDSSVTADTESLEPAVEPDCASDTALTAALGMETALPVIEASFSWTCGSCSISACANRPVGTPCGSGRYCVVTTVCTTQPLTERCVCGTHHF